MGASRIYEETGGDHAFPSWQGGRRVVAKRGGAAGTGSRNRGDMGAEPRFAGPWEEPGRKLCCNKEGVSQA